MVAMTVLAVLLTILLSMVNGASQLWRDSERRVDAFREARAAMNLITSELETLYASPDPKFIAVATDDDDIKELVRTPAPEDVGSALFFLTALPASAQDPTANKSDLCAVGYFVAFAKASASADAKSSYNLYRYFVSSDDTFANIINDRPLPFFGTGSSPTSAPSIASASIKQVEIVARNITKFEIKSYTLVANAAGDFSELEEFKQSSEFPNAAPGSTNPVPDVIDITLVAVNQDTADRWEGEKSDWEDVNSITYEQNARTFTARVYLPTAHLANDRAAPTPSPTP